MHTTEKHRYNRQIVKLFYTGCIGSLFHRFIHIYVNILSEKKSSTHNGKQTNGENVVEHRTD